MSISLKKGAAALSVGCALVGAAVAQEDAPAAAERDGRSTGVYMRVAVGVDFGGDLDQSLSFAPSLTAPLPTNRLTETGAATAFGAAIGFQYAGRTRTELEYRRLGGDIESVVESGGGAPAATLAPDARLTAHALMSNVYVDFGQGRLKPYLGVGVGGARVENGLGQRDAAFAYQGRAGFEFDLGGGHSIGAEFAHLRTLDVVFESPPSAATFPPTADGDGFASSTAMVTLRKLF